MRPASPQSAQLPPQLPPLPADSLAMALTVAGDAIGYVRNGHALNDGFTALWRHYPDLPASTRGAAQDMIYGTLRDYGRGEFLLSRLLQQPLTEPTIDGLLRVALHRLEVRADTAHTVVDQAVEAAARIARGGLKGLVNGVLRNALRQWDSLMAAAELNEEARLRHPKWWITRLRKSAPENWREQLLAANTHPPMSLRINRRRTTLAAATTALQTAGIAYRPLGDFSLILDKPVPVASLPGYAEGLLSVQDWGAQQAAALLDLQDGQRVLDACAAPGGKTAHMLESADLQLMALDADPERAQRVETQLARLGLSASVKAADCRRTQDWWDGRPFERILADVPCSASGVARRHPDIKWLRQADDVAGFATQQAEILDALWPTLAVGGKMLYVTCSIFAEENSLQVARFASRHADCQRLAFADGQLEARWLPGPEHDGFYFALLQKHAAP
ncbi:16S rRNA (cytosine(967)-C(5))-methyltransferase RsmB [Uliginosibacterium sp. H3]|uniref:16S rRNA (cytosine(967)-C(5))-methyltransferase n=1 Tax=Uliginosibacterium silvisoli TaxID=3114758 RepID=A0ABU6K2Z1_9RHOO|nr:16S rRNA (cytosine(967)-C(5))-methyltransferase RsmB [Uliginosibacterium sp. H3]